MSKKKPLVNAGEIIERFGGIRPMAAKIDTPVTTVQGWKKRDVIPGTRRTQILEAAHNNSIDLSDLTSVEASNQNTSSAKKKVTKKASKKTVKSSKSSSKKVATSKKIAPSDVENEVDAKVNVNPTSVPSASVRSNEDAVTVEDKKEDVTFKAQKPEQEKAEQSKTTHESLMGQIEKNNRKALATSIWVTTGLILLAILVGAFLFWPKVKDSQEQIDKQGQQLVQLNDEVKEVKEETSRKFLGTSLPGNMQDKFDSLQNQARNLSLTVDQISEKAQSATGEFAQDGSKAFSKRLDSVEGKIEQLSGPEGSFSSMVSRIRDLEESVTGQLQLEDSADQLRSIMRGSVEGGVVDGQATDEGALGKTLDGVSREDLKAAAILIAFSQFRSSLEREAPFEQDLALLQKLVGDDNPELTENLTRLSAHANGGVLTSSGLSSELKKMTGDIVVSSLTGEDVSIKEKAKARFGDILQVEKDGELVTGTETQVTVAKAQSLIDEGKIEESVVTLESLDGEAAQAAKPFIDQAKGALLADKVKMMLNEAILKKVTGQVDSLQEGISGIDMPDFGLPSAPAGASAPDSTVEGGVTGSLNLDGLTNGFSESFTGKIPENLNVDSLKNLNPLKQHGDVVIDKESGVIILPASPTPSFDGQ